MADNAVTPEAPVQAEEKVEYTQFTTRIPTEQFNRLVNDERYVLKMEKPDYFQHIFNTYEKVSQSR